MFEVFNHNTCAFVINITLTLEVLKHISYALVNNTALKLEIFNYSTYALVINTYNSQVRGIQIRTSLIFLNPIQLSVSVIQIHHL